MKDDLTTKLVDKFLLFQADANNTMNHLRDYFLMTVIKEQFEPYLEK
jgi:hypothetical protein